MPGALWREGRPESLGADVTQRLRSGKGIEEESSGQTPRVEAYGSGGEEHTRVTEEGDASEGSCQGT